MDITAYNTGNIGFDTLRNKNTNIAKANGFNVLQAINDTLNHPTMKAFKANKAIKPIIIGCNLVIFAVNDEYVLNRCRTIIHAIWVNRNNGLYQSLHTYNYDVNAVINDRFKYLPTASRNLLKQKAKKYNQAFVMGLDIINTQVFSSNSNNAYEKTLTTKEKKEKYI